jgi:hypothetical protein
MAGTCWGSCDVGVEEMRKLSARSVASSDAMGAIVSDVLFFHAIMYPVHKIPGRLIAVEEKVHVDRTVHDAKRGAGMYSPAGRVGTALQSVCDMWTAMTASSHSVLLPEHDSRCIATLCSARGIYLT